jgi:hypothetical protein
MVNGAAIFLLVRRVSGCTLDYRIIQTDRNWTAFRRGVPIDKLVVMPLEAPETLARAVNAIEFSTKLVFDSFSDVSPEEVKKLLSKVQEKDPVERAMRLGTLVGAHAVLFGRVDRFRERDGDQKTVNIPASVAFQLYNFIPGLQSLRPFDAAHGLWFDPSIKLRALSTSKGKLTTLTHSIWLRVTVRKIEP